MPVLPKRCQHACLEPGKLELSDGIRAGLQPATYFLAAASESGEVVRNCSAELRESLLWRLCLPTSANAAEAGWYQKQLVILHACVGWIKG